MGKTGGTALVKAAVLAMKESRFLSSHLQDAICCAMMEPEGLLRVMRCWRQALGSQNCKLNTRAFFSSVRVSLSAQAGLEPRRTSDYLEVFSQPLPPRY